jgi:hypothetical protein
VNDLAIPKLHDHPGGSLGLDAAALPAEANEAGVENPAVADVPDLGYVVTELGESLPIVGEPLPDPGVPW